ncbi:hypothetical protein CC2G_000474 [Coprinopsis cinerea AmutBmut pab1-1]|nr:hypothetical protein CC2G_000474 [Coprinopsis cinerea AmutBmut pab1-1]
MYKTTMGTAKHWQFCFHPYHCEGYHPLLHPSPCSPTLLISRSLSLSLHPLSLRHSKMRISLSSALVVAALLGSVAAYNFDDGADGLEARDFTDYDVEARELDFDLDLDARDVNDGFGLEARDPLRCGTMSRLRRGPYGRRRRFFSRPSPGATDAPAAEARDFLEDLDVFERDVSDDLLERGFEDISEIVERELLEGLAELEVRDLGDVLSELEARNLENLAELVERQSGEVATTPPRRTGRKLAMGRRRGRGRGRGLRRHRRLGKGRRGMRRRPRGGGRRRNRRRPTKVAAAGGEGATSGAGAGAGAGAAGPSPGGVGGAANVPAAAPEASPVPPAAA